MKCIEIVWKAVGTSSWQLTVFTAGWAVHMIGSILNNFLGKNMFHVNKYLRRFFIFKIQVRTLTHLRHRVCEHEMNFGLRSSLSNGWKQTQQVDKSLVTSFKVEAILNLMLFLQAQIDYLIRSNGKL